MPDPRTVDEKLARKPKLYAGKLRDMKYGCELLIEHWEGLTRVLKARGDWNDAQKNLALDLVGADAEHREGYPLFRIGAPDDSGKLLAEREAFAAARIEELRERMEGLVDFIDGVQQDYAKAGIRLDDPRAIANFKRYERECRRRMERYRKELLERSAARSVATPPPVESPKPTAPEPRFDEVLDTVEENDRLIATASIPEIAPPEVAATKVEFDIWADRTFTFLGEQSRARGAAAVAAPRRKKRKRR